VAEATSTVKVEDVQRLENTTLLVACLLLCIFPREKEEEQTKIHAFEKKIIKE